MWFSQSVLSSASAHTSELILALPPQTDSSGYVMTFYVLDSNLIMSCAFQKGCEVEIRLDDRWYPATVIAFANVIVP